MVSLDGHPTLCFSDKSKKLMTEVGLLLVNLFRV